MCAAARVIAKISSPGVGEILGMTSVGDELFMLLQREEKQVAVYSVNRYKLLRHLNVSGLAPSNDSDITSCVRRRCLYMSDYHKSCICRYDLDSSATCKWPLPSDCEARGLSVTPSINLLVTCSALNKLVELSSDSGRCVREIELQSDIVNPCHSVQLNTGQIAVCHGVWNRGLQRVCVVGDDGKVVRSYGAQCCSDVGHLDYPRHLAVVKDSRFIFVADRNNNRVVLLRTTLEFVRVIGERLTYPQRLYIHEETRRLFVSQSNNDVVVIQL